MLSDINEEPPALIYRATYSGVNVVETIVQGTPVMKRRSDSYLNATQILKVAGLDKGKRSKILDREIILGEHEKVQGGYGKYQGTWIPFDRAKELAKRYHVADLMQPIIDFDLSTVVDETDLPTKEEAMKTMLKRVPSEVLSPQPQSPTSSIASPASSHVASPLPLPVTAFPPTTPSSSSSAPHTTNAPSSSSSLHKRPAPQSDDVAPRGKKPKTPNHATTASHHANASHPSSEINGERHRAVLMAIFLADDSGIIPELLRDDHGIDINLIIDDQGHTAVHWAASLARINTLDFLISKGADVCRVNYAGETPLMRTVMMTNAFENNTFPSILKLLAPSLQLADHKDRTVFHHVALSSGMPGRAQAAAYYTQHLLRIDKDHACSQDKQGETPFMIATRLCCRELVDMLPDIKKKVKRPKDPLLRQHQQEQLEQARQAQNERSRAAQTSAQTTSTSANAIATAPHSDTSASKPNPLGRELVSIVQNFVDAFDMEHNGRLKDKDKELERVRAELKQMTEQLHDARTKLEAFSLGSQGTATDIHTYASATPSAREQALERKVQMLQTQLANSGTEKEMQCKRLISACCRIPLERVDSMLEPLLLAVESDPPDLDFSRVVGFIESVRRQQQQMGPNAMNKLGDAFSTAPPPPSD